MLILLCENAVFTAATGSYSAGAATGAIWIKAVHKNVTVFTEKHLC